MDDQRAFSGIKVLDFTQGIAGPHSTMLLAQHGADVLKVEPLHGDWGRGMGALYSDHCAHSIAFNRGKRSIALDLKRWIEVLAIALVCAVVAVLVDRVWGSPTSLRDPVLWIAAVVCFGLLGLGIRSTRPGR